jgi:hypothetical protein
VTAPTRSVPATLRIWDNGDGWAWACSYRLATVDGVQRICGRAELGHPDEGTAQGWADGHHHAVHGGAEVAT